jgi:thiol-disulfide isomerase/thioredoxin
LNYPDRLNTLRRQVDINDNSIAGYSESRDYMDGSLRNKSGRNDSLFLTGTAMMPAGTLKNFLLYETVQNELFRIRDSARRSQLVQQALIQITDKTLKEKLMVAAANLKTLQRGKPAPLIRATSLTRDTFDFTQLKGRYVVIDVWATWCAPCKKEAPYFEQLAEQYTSEELAFVSISIDDDKDDWLSYAPGNRSKVLQLWASNADADLKIGYAISSIPRYILIGPKGDIINADMPPPSDPQFESMLQKETGNNRF